MSDLAIEGRNTMAIFDFDGTITKVDTFNDVIAWKFGRIKFYLVMAIISPLILLYLCQVVSNKIPKNCLFWIFFRSMPHQEFVHICEMYCAVRLDALLRAEALEKINWHVAQGHLLVIVSGSISDWIKPWAANNQMADVIATEVEIKQGILTGRFLSKNCYGAEKVNRLVAKYPNIKEHTVYVYGDSPGDKDMLQMATYSFYRKFN